MDENHPSNLNYFSQKYLMTNNLEEKNFFFQIYLWLFAKNKGLHNNDH